MRSARPADVSSGALRTEIKRCTPGHMKSKPLMTRLEPEVHDKVEEAACEEGRSLSNMIGRIVKEWATKRAAEGSRRAA